METPLQRFEHTLHPWVAFAIVPLFALANAGIHLADVSLPGLLHPVVLGTVAGLVLGKQAGIFGSAWLMVRLGLADKPDNVSWGQVYGAAWLGGIGFTMSIFVSTLAFPTDSLLVLSKLAVLGSSLAAGATGWLILRTFSIRKEGVIG